MAMGGVDPSTAPRLVVARALGKVVVTVHGALDSRRTPMLGRLIDELLQAERQGDVVINLNDVSSVDDGTASVFVQASRTLDLHGARLSIGGAKPDIEAYLSVRGVPIAALGRRTRRRTSQSRGPLPGAAPASPV